MTTLDTNQDTKIGICKWFDKMKGYGFVQEINTDNDFFVHYSQLQSDDDSHSKFLITGEYISFIESEYSNPNTTENSSNTSTRTAGNVTGVGGGPLMYQTQLTQRSYHRQEKDTRPHAHRNVHIARQSVQPILSTTNKVEASNPFSLLAE